MYKAFPKIEQFRTVVKAMSYHDNPTVKFTGTVKLHGTNAGVGHNEDGLWVQSRSRVITPEDDNYGFASFVEARRDMFESLVPLGHIVYGEWCGQGIQKGVGISSLPKMFVIFAMRKIDSDGWLPTTGLQHPESGIYNISAFSTYTLDIDFKRPDIAQAPIKEMVEDVEAECPVAKVLGASGIGEGIVFTGMYAGNTYRFKAKGQKHSVTKVKTVAAIDVEKMDSIVDFVKYAVTENRLRQGLDAIGVESPSMKDMGTFLRWVCADIHAEESDTLEAAGLCAKDVNKHMMTKARVWYTENH